MNDIAVKCLLLFLFESHPFFPSLQWKTLQKEQKTTRKDQWCQVLILLRVHNFYISKSCTCYIVGTHVHKHTKPHTHTHRQWNGQGLFAGRGDI